MEVLKGFFEERLTFYLMLLKITPNLKGYEFMKECARRLSGDSINRFRSSEKLYSDVGKQFNEDKSIIERSVRNAIDVSLNRDGIRDFEKFMKIEFYNKKPTPKELLNMLVEKALVESNKMKLDEENLCKKWKEELIG